MANVAPFIGNDANWYTVLQGVGELQMAVSRMGPGYCSEIGAEFRPIIGDIWWEYRRPLLQMYVGLFLAFSYL